LTTHWAVSVETSDVTRTSDSGSNQINDTFWNMPRGEDGTHESHARNAVPH